MTSLSLYILTRDSQKYLRQILEASKSIADEIVIIDSGSFDDTFQIASEFKCRIFFRTLDNFRAQRQFAISKCKHDWVLSFDSDEIPSPELIQEIQQLKTNGFKHDAYSIKRKWNVLGKEVHVVYPIVSPDYPIRLFNKKIVVYDERSTRAHETPHGYNTLGQIESPLFHYTFETRRVLEEKLKQYSSIASEDLLEQKRPLHIGKLLFSPLAAWFKWFIVKGGYKDGSTGLVLASYAMRYTYLKYKKARKMSG